MADELYIRALAELFRPSQEFRTMWTYWRQRKDLVESAVGTFTDAEDPHADDMQLANVVSDGSG